MGLARQDHGMVGGASDRSQSDREGHREARQEGEVVKPRLAMFSRYVEQGEQLYLECNYYPVTAMDYALREGWELIACEPEEDIEAIRLSEIDRWDIRTRDRL